MKKTRSSQIDFGLLISLSFIIGVISWAVYNINNYLILSLLTFAFPVYYLLVTIVYKFFLLDDVIRIVYYFKFVNRVKIKQYDEIEEVRYLNNTGYSLPTIVFVYKGDKLSTVLKTLNSFSHRSFKKRKEILLFLHSKGIPIYVDSLSKKDFENSISKCNFADKIGKFIFFRARRNNSPLP
jgi:hypothetical protein